MFEKWTDQNLKKETNITGILEFFEFIVKENSNLIKFLFIQF
jgi:hypothetical protein